MILFSGQFGGQLPLFSVICIISILISNCALRRIIVYIDKLQNDPKIKNRRCSDGVTFGLSSLVELCTMSTAKLQMTPLVFIYQIGLHSSSSVSVLSHFVPENHVFKKVQEKRRI